MRHQYIERETGRVRTERLCGDGLIRVLYSREREDACRMYRALTSARLSSLLGFLNYDVPLGRRVLGSGEFLRDVDLTECADPKEASGSLRRLFERKIRYWECRPMPADPRAVMSPADSRLLLGSLDENSHLFLKDKFFHFHELLGREHRVWHAAFERGAFAVFRLTPDKYHYNHTPAAGVVRDIYEIDGVYHSCNPWAVTAVCTPYSRNRRVVTVLDTDVPGGSGAGLVAMVEVVALMIGSVVQCYSVERYEDPRPVIPGMFLAGGRPKSLFRPGSSTVVLLFQPGRVRFAPDLVRNLYAYDVQSRFSAGFGRPLVETEVRVRSWIGNSCAKTPPGEGSPHDAYAEEECLHG